MLNVNGHTLIPIPRIKSGVSIRTTLFVNVEIPESLNYNNNNQKNTKLQSSEIYQVIYCSMLSKDHDPDDSTSEGSGTKRRHDVDDGAGHLVEKATHHSQNEFIKSENLLLILRILVKGKFSTSLPVSDHLSSYYFTSHHQIFYFGTHTIFFFFFKLLASKYWASCTLELPVNTHSKINPNSKIKIILYCFSFFSFFFFNNLVGVIQIFFISCW